MTNDSTAGDGSGGRKPEFGDLFLFHSDKTQPSLSSRCCSSLVANASFNFNKKLDEGSPCPEVDTSPSHLLPWTTTQSSSFTKLPWTNDEASSPPSSCGEDSNFAGNRLVGSLVRAELGHIYSLAASGDLLYTGSDSRNIRVWKKKKDFSGFKSSSGLVKAIVISGEKIFSGHQDGKIRVWKASSGKPSLHKQIGSLPTLKEFVKKSFNPKNYTQNRRHQNVLKIKHYDAVSCLSLNENEGLLYSGSWDKTIKVWRISDSKCLESIKAHDDSVNAVAVSGNGLVFTGSADGTVKAWRRELVIASAGGGDRKPLTKHVLAQILLRQENAITALAVNEGSDVVYCGASDGLMNYYWEREKRLSHGGVVRGHKMAVLCVAAAGRLVFSGSADKSICVWRREEESGVHSCLSVLTGHTGPVKCLAVEEDRQSSRKGEARWVVYSGSLDKSVKIWSVSERSPDLRRIHAGA